MISKIDRPATYRHPYVAFLVAAVALISLAVACGTEPEARPTPEAPAEATVEQTAVPTAVPTPTEAPPPTETPTATATPTAEPPQDLAIDFTLPSARGVDVTLSSYRGEQAVILVFSRGLW